MLLRISFLVGCCTAVAVCLAQSATLGASMGVSVFPAAGQDATQQSIDEAECYNWAVNNTGTDPFQLSQQAQQQMAAADQAMREAEQAGSGSAGMSAAAGAVTGAVVGSIFGNKGRKSTRRAAAAGAVIGGASGSSRSAQATAEATAQVEAQSAQQQAAIGEQMTSFRNAFGACLEGNSYIARS